MDNLSSFDLYRDALLNASSAAGVLCLARQFLADSSLFAWQKNHLFSVADNFYRYFSGFSILSDL